MELGFWKKLNKPIMVIAPMSGVTDEAFRLMFLKHGRPDVFWTEFVSADGLFSRGKKFHSNSEPTYHTTLLHSSTENELFEDD